MAGLLVLLHLGGAIALLLWATRMVRTGVERAYGRYLKERLRDFLRNPIYAVGFGLFMAVVLQSSTAVTLLVSSFVGAGFVSGAAGLMAVRGGELGSALVVKILTFNLSALVPLLLITGTSIFMTTERREWRQLGRILVGVALLILSLKMTGEATAPLRHSAALPAIISYLSSDPISSFLLAAVITYLFHSSVAGIILIASFAAHGMIGPELSVIMVLGVNFGSSVIAPLLTRHATPETRAIPLGNLLMRGAGSLIMLVLLQTFQPPLDFLGESRSTLVVNAHITFNFIILLCGIPLSRPLLKLTGKIVNLQAPIKQEETLYPFSQTALDMNIITQPPLALASAAREIVRIADIVDLMLEQTIKVYDQPDKAAIAEITAFGKILDQRQNAYKLYLSELSRNELTDTEIQRAESLLDACITLQQSGSLISHNMLTGAKQILNDDTHFSKEDKKDLGEYSAFVLGNIRMAFNVLVSSDVDTARQIVRGKDRLRDYERELRQNHFDRLRKGSQSDARASTLYFDLLHELKQVNGLMASLAYPVLEEHGLLKTSRLKGLKKLST